ncbi:MAG TPA: dihydropteroate synthase [Tepidisphaeraceae bacterium]|jgi:dihydropteroate synthase|nr:dihydropteroate synthase [Tepidisphaeraceae bacterium]
MTPSALSSWLADPHRPTLVMGILNLTPDSFSDGGKFAAADAALAHAEQMAADGADWIDIGAESTRPGSLSVSADEQLQRLMPVLSELRKRVAVVLSIDTTQAAVAAAALEAGVNVVNDISAGRDSPGMFPLVARHHAPIILMHMQGNPATMQQAPHYQDVTAEVSQFHRRRISAAVSEGVEPANILLDPGIGFGKTADHNLQLLRDLPAIATLGTPLVVGASRKGFIEKITGERAETGRPFGTAATVAWSAANGAAIVRVHDVRAMKQVLAMVSAIRSR